MHNILPRGIKGRIVCCNNMIFIQMGRHVPSYYVWAKPKYIEFAFFSRFHFSTLDCYFSLGFYTINLQV